MAGYHLLPAAAGDMSCLAGEHARARDFFLQAAAAAPSQRERTTLQNRAADCLHHP